MLLFLCEFLLQINKITQFNKITQVNSIYLIGILIIRLLQHKVKSTFFY